MQENIYSIEIQGVPFDDIVAFKAYQLQLSKEKAKRATTKQTLLFLMERVKEKLQQEKVFLSTDEKSSFIEELKNAKKNSLQVIENKKKLHAKGLCEHEKQLFYNLSYSLYIKERKRSISYPEIISIIIRENKYIDETRRAEK